MFCAVVILDIKAPLGQDLGVFVREATFDLVGFLRLDSLCTLVSRIHHLSLLSSDTTTNDGIFCFSNHWLEHLYLVRVHLTTNNRLAQTITSGNDDNIAKACIEN